MFALSGTLIISNPNLYCFSNQDYMDGIQMEVDAFISGGILVWNYVNYTLTWFLLYISKSCWFLWGWHKRIWLTNI